MCGRYVSRIEAALEREWALSGTPPPFESYNVAPTQNVPVVRERDGMRACELLRWGLVPFHARGVPPKLSTINARVEAIRTAVTWRGPWMRGQRCVLPALGFYEWQLVGDRKQPWYIHLTDQDVFGFAGLWDASPTGEDGRLESVTIVTVPANPFVAEIHNTKRRMPAILARADLDTWLSGEPAAAYACLGPYPDALMAAYTVGLAVNSPKHNGPELMAPAPPLARQLQ